MQQMIKLRDGSSYSMKYYSIDGSTLYRYDTYGIKTPIKYDVEPIR